RRVVIAGLALMVAGGVLTASAGSFAPALAGRIVSGVGAVLMNILLARLTSDWFAGKELSTAMGVMLTSWPVGLGLATATLGGIAAASGWRWAVSTTAIAAAVGLLLMLLGFREAPRVAGAAAAAPRASLTPRDRRLSISAGVAWGCFNASLVAIIAFGPGLLIARGTSLGDAGFVVSLAIWLTIVSIPLGGLLGDRLGRPPGPLMALLPRALPPASLTRGFGVFYTIFYVMMALTQPAAGLVRDRFGDPAAPIVFAAVVMACTVVGLV